MSSQGPTSPRALKRSPTTSFLTNSPRLTTELEKFPNDFIDFIKGHLRKVKKRTDGHHLSFQMQSGLAASTHSDETIVYHPPESAGHYKEMNALVILAQTDHSLSPFLLLKDQKLGEGAEGRVVKALNLETDEIVACKIVRHYGLDFDYAQVKREQSNLKRLDRFKGEYVYQKNEHVLEYTFMPYYPGTTLLDQLYTVVYTPNQNFIAKKSFDFLNLTRMCFAAIDEMLWIHEKGLVFRDFKPGNFIFYQGIHPDDFKLTFVDVGSALPLTEATDCKYLDGTSHGYVDPAFAVEIESRPGFSPQSDYFSLAILLAEILTTHNFQDTLRKKLIDIQKDEGCVRELTHEEITSMMPDIFAGAIPDGQTSIAKLRAQLIQLIRDLASPLEERINESALIEQRQLLQKRLSMALIEERHQNKPADSRRTFKLWKANRKLSDSGERETRKPDAFSESLSERRSNRDIKSAGGKRLSSSASMLPDNDDSLDILEQRALLWEFRKVMISEAHPMKKSSLQPKAPKSEGQRHKKKTAKKSKHRTKV